MRLLRYLSFGVVAVNFFECGEVASTSPDGSVDAQADAVAILCVGPFGAPTPITELNTPRDDESLRLSRDELTAAFAHDDGVDDSTLVAHGIYVTRRASRASAFPSPIEVPHTGLPQSPDTPGDTVFPSLTADGMALFYEGGVGGFSGAPCSYLGPDGTDSGVLSTMCFLCGDGGIQSYGSSCYTTIQLGTSGGKYYGIDGYVDVLPFNPFYGHYFGAHWIFGNGYVTGSASTYYFATRIDDAGAVNGIFSGAKYGTSPQIGFGQVSSDIPPFPNTFVPVFTPSGSSDPSALVDHPIVSSDELTLYVSVLDTTGTPHINVATRANTGQPFTSLNPVHELDSAEGEYASWISFDQCRLYMSRKVGGQWDLFVASRAAP